MKANKLPAGRSPAVRLRMKGARNFAWVYRKMVRDTGRAAAGDFVDVVDDDGAFLGRGIWNPHSEIAVRLLGGAAGQEPADLLREKLAAAASLRRDTLRIPDVSDAWRLCHAEGDGLSGLVIDLLGPVAVVELFSIGWFRRRDVLRSVLGELLPGLDVHFRADEDIERLEGFRLPDAPAPPRATVVEHGVKFHVDFERGHKTGFFCDQRDNRRAVAGFASGRNVLDLCTYTGGFALSASQAGAARVMGVDLDERALETARANAKLNRSKAEFRHADLFNYLRQLRPDDAPDLVVLDPPKLARSREDLVKAKRTYRDMNLLSMKAVRRGGILVTCSCSGLVSEPDFLDILRDAARFAERELRIFRVAGAGPDHPVSTRHPEGRYLKAVFAVVA